MVFLAAALASASLAVPEGWGEEGEPHQAPHTAPHVPGMGTLAAPNSSYAAPDLSESGCTRNAATQ